MRKHYVYATTTDIVRRYINQFCLTHGIDAKYISSINELKELSVNTVATTQAALLEKFQEKMRALDPTCVVSMTSALEAKLTTYQLTNRYTDDILVVIADSEESALKWKEKVQYYNRSAWICTVWDGQCITAEQVSKMEQSYKEAEERKAMLSAEKEILEREDIEVGLQKLINERERTATRADIPEKWRIVGLGLLDIAIGMSKLKLKSK